MNEKADLPELTRQAQRALALHPSARPGPNGTDAVKRVSAGSLPPRLAGARVGLHSRHANVAVNAAFTWCRLMLDTLADPEAPWRT